MPFSLPSDPSDGQVAPASWGDAVRAGLSYLANPPSCRIRHNTTQTMTNDVDTLVVFNTEWFDSAAMHSTSVNTSRITVPDAGIYLFTFTGEMIGATYTKLYGFFRLNGTTPIGMITSDNNYVAGSTLWKCAASDYVEVMVRQASGSNRVLNSSFNYSPEFGAVWVGLG